MAVSKISSENFNLFFEIHVVHFLSNLFTLCVLKIKKKIKLEQNSHLFIH